MWILRKLLNEMKVIEAMEFMITRMKRTKSKRRIYGYYEPVNVISA